MTGVHVFPVWDPVAGKFTVEFDIATQPDGEAECVALTVRQRPDGPPVTGDVLRRVMPALTALVAARWWDDPE